MRVLTPMLLLAGCQVPSVEGFTGLTPTPRAMQRQAYPYPTSSSLSGVVRQRRCGAGTTVVMMAKPTEAAVAKDAKVDPAVVEAALVEEDKNV